MPIRRLSMKAQVKKTHSNSGKGRMGPGKTGRPGRTNQRILWSSASGHVQAKPYLMRAGLRSRVDLRCCLLFGDPCLPPEAFPGGRRDHVV
jgi:hypothetical protein